MTYVSFYGAAFEPASAEATTVVRLYDFNFNE
jgi:hypothetical protein